MSIYIDEVMTIEMIPITHIVGIVRCHSDPNKIPGDVEWTCVADIDDNICELKILSGQRGTTNTEARRLIQHFKAQGYTVKWHRYKNDKESKEVTVK